MDQVWVGGLGERNKQKIAKQKKRGTFWVSSGLVFFKYEVYVRPNGKVEKELLFANKCRFIQHFQADCQISPPKV